MTQVSSFPAFPFPAASGAAGGAAADSGDAEGFIAFLTGMKFDRAATASADGAMVSALALPDRALPDLALRAVLVGVPLAEKTDNPVATGLDETEAVTPAEETPDGEMSGALPLPIFQMPPARPDVGNKEAGADTTMAVSVAAGSPIAGVAQPPAFAGKAQAADRGAEVAVVLPLPEARDVAGKKGSAPTAEGGTVPVLPVSSAQMDGVGAPGRTAREDSLQDPVAISGHSRPEVPKTALISPESIFRPTKSPATESRQAEDSEAFPARERTESLGAERPPPMSGSPLQTGGQIVMATTARADPAGLTDLLADDIPRLAVPAGGPDGKQAPQPPLRPDTVTFPAGAVAPSAAPAAAVASTSGGEIMIRSLWSADSVAPAMDTGASTEQTAQRAGVSAPLAIRVDAGLHSAPELPSPGPQRADTTPQGLVPPEQPKTAGAGLPAPRPEVERQLPARPVLPAATMDAAVGSLSPVHAPLAHRVEAGAPPPAPTPVLPVPLQIVQAAVDVGSGVTEVRMSPEELGLVRLEVRSDGDRLVMNVSAERQDTLDLLRRHADQLAAELRNAGHQGLDLSFSRWSGRDAGPETGGQPQEPPTTGPEQSKTAEVAAEPAALRPHIPSTGLYLRI